MGSRHAGNQKKEATAIRSPCEIARRHLLAFVIMDEEEEGFRMLKRNNPIKFLEEKKKKKPNPEDHNQNQNQNLSKT